jgi:hypothetical protein
MGPRGWAGWELNTPSREQAGMNKKTINLYDNQYDQAKQHPSELRMNMITNSGSTWPFTLLTARVSTQSCSEAADANNQLV